MFGWLKSAISLGAKIFSLFKNENGPVDYMDGLEFAVGQLLPTIRKAVEYKNLDTKEKVDSWLKTIDDVTGQDQFAVDIFKTLPDDQEEVLFDHLIEAGRIYAYNLIKVPNYYAE